MSRIIIHAINGSMILTKIVSEFVSPWVRSKLCQYSLSAEFT